MREVNTEAKNSVRVIFKKFKKKEGTQYSGGTGAWREARGDGWDSLVVQ